MRWDDLVGVLCKAIPLYAVRGRKEATLIRKKEKRPPPYPWLSLDRLVVQESRNIHGRYLSLSFSLTLSLRHRKRLITTKKPIIIICYN